ncbi:MAG: hemolysin family protein [Saprospiraceae bacterium]
MLLTIVILSLLFSALFSGTEIAFISASKLRVELLKKRGSRRGRVLAGFYDKPSDFLGAMLVGNNIVLVIFASLMDQILNPYLEQFIHTELLMLLVSTILVTIIVLLFGEFLPKTLFRLYADDILYFLAYPLRGLKFLLAVPAWIMIKLSNFLLRYLFRTPTEEADNVFTRLDLEQFIQTSRSDTEEEIDRELFEKALNLKETRVRECMIPRPEIEYIDETASIDELEELFKESNLSRLLVINGDIDEVTGYVHHQQLFSRPKTIDKIILDVPVVPEVMRVRDLMDFLIKERMSLACVVDEFGGTAGIITLEDILEEIFGEIEDEHDQEEYVETQISSNEYLFSGRLEISHLNEKYDLHFPEGDYSTISGYIVMTAQEIPEQGAIIELENYRFVLELVSDTKIETVRVIKIEKSEEEK